MKFNVIVKEDKLDGGYIAYVPELKGCFTQADSLDELKKNIIEAIEVSLDENEEISPIFGIWEVDINAANSYN
ncbi:type II toxin-antitoxin system HicB family antitoxin [Caminibacter pacificus]